jgi:hypothetical protein
MLPYDIKQAQFAPVVPLSIANALDTVFLGDYHLLLAHDVLKNPDSYKWQYASKAVKIMDNSLIELGYAMKIQDVVKAANIVGAQFVVLPDKLKDAAWTEEATKLAKFDFDKLDTNETAGISPMPVLQGVNYVECKYLLETWASEGYKAVAIPRVLVEVFGSRKDTIHKAISCGFKYIHLLGFSEDLQDDVDCTRIPGVMGIDSAVPIRLGLQKKAISLKNYVDPGPRGDYWDNPMQGSSWPETEGKLLRIELNMELFREWIKTTN